MNEVMKEVRGTVVGKDFSSVFIDEHEYRVCCAISVDGEDSYITIIAGLIPSDVYVDDWGKTLKWEIKASELCLKIIRDASNREINAMLARSIQIDSYTLVIFDRYPDLPVGVRSLLRWAIDVIAKKEWEENERVLCEIGL